MDEVAFTTDEAAPANRIQRLDARIDALEQRSLTAAEGELRAGGSIIGAFERESGRDRRDSEHQRLLDERAALVQQLQQDVGDAS